MRTRKRSCESKGEVMCVSKGQGRGRGTDSRGVEGEKGAEGTAVRTAVRVLILILILRCMES